MPVRCVVGGERVSPLGCTVDEERSRSPSDIGGTLRTCSPSAARGCRLVGAHESTLYRRRSRSSMRPQIRVRAPRKLSNTVSVPARAAAASRSESTQTPRPRAHGRQRREPLRLLTPTGGRRTRRDRNRGQARRDGEGQAGLADPPDARERDGSQPARSVANRRLISSRPNPRRALAAAHRGRRPSRDEARVDSDRTSPRGRPPTAITCSRSTSGAEGTVPTSSRRHAVLLEGPERLGHATHGSEGSHALPSRPVAERMPFDHRRSVLKGDLVLALAEQDVDEHLGRAGARSSSRAVSAHAHSSWTNSAYAPPLHMSNARSSDARTSAPAPSSVSAEFTASSNCRWSMRSDTSM